MDAGKCYRLLGADGRTVESDVQGTLGGNSRNHVYGRLDCKVALAALPKGIYQRYRVFFADQATAVAAGYRPCSKCLPAEYRQWKLTQPR